MPEVRPQEKEGCVLHIKVDDLSQRETFSRETNERFGEGGGLNANYRQMEAVARLSNILGKSGMEYGRDFTVITVNDDVSIALCEEESAVKVWQLLGLCRISCEKPGVNGASAQTAFPWPR